MQDRRRVIDVLLLTALIAIAITPTAVAQEKGVKSEGKPQGQSDVAPAGARAGDLQPQTTCPIMGGKINKKVFVDVAGYRIYACCPACLPKIKADPAKAVATLKAKGEKPELRLVLCSKCGEIRGTAACCKPDAKKCSKCALKKGSIGCCRDLTPLAGKEDVLICPKCGEVKGSAACCKPGAKKCSKCRLAVGSPGCCKLGSFTKGVASRSGSGTKKP